MDETSHGRLPESRRPVFIILCFRHRIGNPEKTSDQRAEVGGHFHLPKLRGEQSAGVLERERLRGDGARRLHGQAAVSRGEGERVWNGESSGSLNSTR